MTKRLLIVPVLTALLVFGTVSPIWATVNFNGFLPLDGHSINPTYNFEKSFFINYPAGSKLQSMLQNKNVTIAFTDDASSNPDIKKFMQQINTDIATNEHSSAVITNLTINYLVAVTGYPDHTAFDYKIVLAPTVTNYVLNTASGDIPETLDASWIAFSDQNPVTITTKQYGPLEINSPIGVIQSQLPDVYNEIKSTGALQVFQTPYLMDATGLYTQQPLNKWDSLFDPAYTLAETAGFGFAGNKVAVTTYSSGLSGLVTGSATVNNVDQDFTGSDGTKYHISTREQPNAGTINVEGHANPNLVQGGWTFATTAQAAAGISNTTAGGTSTMMFYAMAGFAAVIAAGIFWWSNKKMKSELNRVKTEEVARPLEYETRQHWADKFDVQSSGAMGTDSQPGKPDDKKRSAI
ncbi:MAG: hypothetical protein ACREA3_08990 [Nitrosotalea sp.]